MPLSIFTISLSIYLLMDTSCFHLLVIVNNTAIIMGCSYLFKLVCLISSNKYPEVKLLDHMVVPFLICMVFHHVCVNVHSYPQCTRVPFSLHPPNTYYLFFDCSPCKQVWCGISCLDCISQMISAVEHIFMYLLAICTSLWENVHLCSEPIS